MSPKEKAEQLVAKFDGVGLQMRNEAIACALICVNEILSNPMFFSDWGTVYFWQQVKIEIEKL